MNVHDTLGTILIVDDELDILFNLSEILTEKGYSVQTAKSGQEALDIVNENSPDLILLAVKLPDLSGYEVCARLKSNEKTSFIPILFLSELITAKDKISGFSVGALDYIKKPFVSEEVIAHVEIHLEVSKLSKKLKLTNEQLLIELSEHKEQEKRIYKINRLYSILYEIDEAIVKIHDKKRLFDEVCRIAFNNGKFLMSWIGIINSENKLNILASSGFAEDYLDKINIDLNDEARSSGPTGRSLKLGKYQFSNDIKNDVSMTPWKEDALKLGYKSSASFPLKIAGKIRGALTLYSNEVGFFIEDEIKLIEKLASNLSFAIEFIENEEDRKRTEIALLESEAHIKSISNNFTNGMIYQVVIRPDGTRKFTYLSDSVKQLYGISPEEGMLDANLIYSKVCEDDIESLIKTENEAIKNVSVFKAEVRIKEPSGKIRWSYLVSTPKMLNDGSICFDGIEFIITELKIAGEKMKDQYILLSALINSPKGVIIFSLDTNYCYTAFNEKHHDEMKSIWGADIKIGMNLLECMTIQEFVDLAKKSMDRVLKGESFLEIQYQSDHNVYYEFNWSPVFKAKEIIGITVFIRDITESKLTENTINTHLSLNKFAFTHSLNELLQKTLDEVCSITNSPIGFYHFVEPDQKILSLQAWSTRTLQEYCKAEGNDLHYDIKQAGVWADCVRQLKPIVHNDYASLENKKGLPEGHAKLVRELVVPIIRNGLVVAILGIGNKEINYTEKDIELVAYFADVAWEIIQKKRAEEELYKMNEELEQRVIKRTEELENSNKELESFSYSISHDLRAPLRAIDGFSNILLKNHSETLGTEEKRLLNKVCDNAKKMAYLIDDLLAFSRINRYEVHKSEIDMNFIVDSVYHEITSEEERSNIDFLVNDLPKAKCDASMMKQIWVNLISNAVKFTSKIEKPKIEISFKVEKGTNIYFIKDNGVGFDINYSDKLFGVFQRLHSESEYKGTGVGLAIVKSIITKHNGKIWVESKVDVGTTFYFWI